MLWSSEGDFARIYRISTRMDTGSDTFGQPQLTAANHQPAAKTLVLDLADQALPLWITSKASAGA